MLAEERPRAGERWLIAFSGGPDSTALAAGLAPLARDRELDLLLVHVDHALDPGSPARARRAIALAAELGLPCRPERVDVPALRNRAESPESSARRLRYAALERVRSATAATLVLTAHHRDDQVETLLLQLLRGAPLEQLGGIPERRGVIRRPLLGLPRAALLEALRERGIEAITDPTNRDRRIPRNRVRHELLPRLHGLEPALDEALLALAERARALRERLERSFRAAPPGPASPPAAKWLRELPEPLQLPALRWLLRERLGVERAPSRSSMRVFLSQLDRDRSARLRLPGGSGEVAVRSGEMRREAPRSRNPPFTYSFLIPGEVELPELGLRLRIRRAPVEPWMFRGDPTRAALTGNATSATVRTRLPGDRLRPLGATGARKLKELLIDRRVPATERDRLPLLELGGRLAWVPGVAIEDAFRLAGDSECWVAEMIPAPEPLAESEVKGERMSKT